MSDSAYLITRSVRSRITRRYRSIFDAMGLVNNVAKVMNKFLSETTSFFTASSVSQFKMEIVHRAYFPLHLVTMSPPPTSISHKQPASRFHLVTNNHLPLPSRHNQPTSRFHLATISPRPAFSVLKRTVAIQVSSVQVSSRAIARPRSRRY